MCLSSRRQRIPTVVDKSKASGSNAPTPFASEGDPTVRACV